MNESSNPKHDNKNYDAFSISASFSDSEAV